MYFIFIFTFMVGLITVQRTRATSLLEREAEYYTNTWAVRITAGAETAKEIAKENGFDYYDQVSEGHPDLYLFRKSKYPEKTKFHNGNLTRMLKSHPKITWAEQQVAETRATRSQSVLTWDGNVEEYACPGTNTSNGTPVYKSLNLNDKYWLQQYYIQDCRTDFNKPPSDLNLVPVWIKHHLFGNNIKVIVVDDGVETTHLDLVDNYDPRLGLDLQDDDSTPDPVHMNGRKFSHGTRCAGVIGMKANNTICGVGIAPMVTLGAIRLLGPNPSTDYKDGKALVFRYKDVHIMSNSWGPNDDGKTMSYFGPLTQSALKTGITEGRQGKGLIYIFACGNGKKDGDNCGCDPFVSTIYTIAVASCDHRGKVTNYSERCSSVMVTTYSGDRSTPYNVVTTDVGRDKCTTEHTGTSASAPMVSGAIALALEANPNLTWRDIQYLLAWTSNVAPLQDNPPGTWFRNGAGFYVSHDFGFGMLNINDLVEKAKKFKRVAAMNTCISDAEFNRNGQTFQRNLKVDIVTIGCEGKPTEVAYLEHVQVTLSLAFPRRGDLMVSLTSPSGTKARLLDPRPFDSYPLGISLWTFDSVMTWGESPKGKWTIRITDKGHSHSRFARSRTTSSSHNEIRSPADDLRKIIDSIKQTGCPITRFGRKAKKFWSDIKDTLTNEVILADPAGHQVYGATPQYTGVLKELTLIFHGTSSKQKPKLYKDGPRPYYEFTSPT